jgi:hypothetical protein
MLGAQAHLFFQFPEHGLFWRFSRVDTALGKLPGVLVNALAPENLVVRVAQYNAYVRAVPFSVDHGRHHQ